jgi:hypothetical protein
VGELTLGIHNPAITVTGSPRAKRWERGGREGEGVVAWEKQMRERERGGAPGARVQGRAGSRRGTRGQKSTMPTTTDRNPTENQKPETK